MTRSPASSSDTELIGRELGRGRRPAVAAVARGAVARDGVDVVGRHRLAEVGADWSWARSGRRCWAIGDDDVAVGIEGHPARGVELGRGGGPAVARGTRRVVPGDGVDVIGRHRLAEVGARGGGHETHHVVGAYRRWRYRHRASRAAPPGVLSSAEVAALPLPE